MRAIYRYDTGDESMIELVRASHPDEQYHWQASSAHDVVWVSSKSLFRYELYGLRLEDGRPAGEPFWIADNATWPAIDRNLVVWTGAAAAPEGQVVQTGVIAAELELADTDDVGDVDGNGTIELTDGVALLNYLFLGGWRPRLRRADADGDRRLDLTDAVRILEYLFLDGAAPGRR